MRTAAWKTAPQVALRNCSKEAGGEGQYICDFGKKGINVLKYITFRKIKCALIF